MIEQWLRILDSFTFRDAVLALWEGFVISAFCVGIVVAAGVFAS